MARPIQRGVLQDEASAPCVSNLSPELIESTPPAEFGPPDTEQCQSDLLLLQGIAEVFTIFQHGIGWFIPPSENRNPTFMHLRKGPASPGEGGA